MKRYILKSNLNRREALSFLQPTTCVQKIHFFGHALINKMWHHNVKKQIQQWVQQSYDLMICTPERLMQQKIRRCKPGAKKISVAIPHWHRAAFIHQPLWNILNDERIQEIVIVDDGSSEEEFSLLMKNIAKYDQRKVITVHRREKNQGAQFTKMECVEKAKGDWMILLDADNTLFPSCLDRMTSIENPHHETIYCADWAYPYFSFRRFSGERIDFKKMCQLVGNKSNRQSLPLNDGNFLFHRTSYLQQLQGLKQIEYGAADVMLVNYVWLSQGGSMQILNQASYLHRLHETSFWKRTAHDSRKYVRVIFDRLEKELSWQNKNVDGLSLMDELKV